MNKIIWTCWFQGRQDAPDLVQRCLASWETLNPDWEFRCLDVDTVGRYIDLDEYVDLQNQTITAASLSDILRLLLLHEYGGVWVDATLFCNRPLNEWLHLSMKTGFFAFSKPAPDRILASWFIAAEYDHLLLARWLARVMKYWQGRKQSDDYFWLHHQFGELCNSDTEALSAWQSVPKISADGPHSIQKAGMYEPAESAGLNIDWTIPVFKLTYRLEQDAYRPGCLVHHVLYSRDLVKYEPKARSSNEAPSLVKIAQQKVATGDLGDQINILAGQKILKRLGFASEQPIDLGNDMIPPAVLNGQKSMGMLLNGCVNINPTGKLLHARIIPLYLGVHICAGQAPALMSSEALEHYRQFGPIGCCDGDTLSLLKGQGIDAFLSHCLSLTFPRRIEDPGNQIETIIVSRDKDILDYLPGAIRSYRFLSHDSNTTDFTINMQRAAEMILLYRSRAKVIITNLLHCALPAVAMGIPVVVFLPSNDDAQILSNNERFSSLQEIIPVFHLNEAKDVDWRGYTADISHIKLTLINLLFEMAERWGRVPGTRLGPIASASALPVP